MPRLIDQLRPTVVGDVFWSDTGNVWEVLAVTNRRPQTAAQGVDVVNVRRLGVAAPKLWRAASGDTHWWNAEVLAHWLLHGFGVRVFDGPAAKAVRHV